MIVDGYTSSVQLLKNEAVEIKMVQHSLRDSFPVKLAIGEVDRKSVGAN